MQLTGMDRRKCSNGRTFTLLCRCRIQILPIWTSENKKQCYYDYRHPKYISKLNRRNFHQPWKVVIFSIISPFLYLSPSQVTVYSTTFGRDTGEECRRHWNPWEADIKVGGMPGIRNEITTVSEISKSFDNERSLPEPWWSLWNKKYQKAR